MTIPIANIYYLLLYAWRHVEKRDVVDVGRTGKSDLLNLLAHVFVVEVRRLIARGLAREYVPVEESVAGVRGKMDIGITLKRALLRHAKTWCRYDELQYDVPRNRVIRATLRTLLRVGQLDRDNREAARALHAKLDAVRDVPLHPSMFRGLQSHRLVRDYDFALKLAQLIADSVILDESGAAARFVDFSRDEARMHELFEDFVFNFYALEKPEWRARREIIHWFEASGTQEALGYLPSMHTDVYLSVGDRDIIVDAKYYKDPLRGRSGPSVSSENLYQIFSYVENASAASTRRVDGLLLYAAVHDPFWFQYRLKGRDLGVRGLDLTKDWRSLHHDLLSFIAK